MAYAFRLERGCQRGAIAEQHGFKREGAVAHAARCGGSDSFNRMRECCEPDALARSDTRKRGRDSVCARRGKRTYYAATADGKSSAGATRRSCKSRHGGGWIDPSQVCAACRYAASGERLHRLASDVVHRRTGRAYGTAVRNCSRAPILARRIYAVAQVNGARCDSLNFTALA